MSTVEIEGPLQKPIAAASLGEAEAAERAGIRGDYEATFGATATIPVQEWEEHHLQELTAADFESVWAAARAACEVRTRTRATPET
jgi:hypothetical protein